MQNFSFAAAGDLTRSNKQRDWTPRNAVLLPPFLTEAAILHGESDAVEFLRIFARSITKWAKEGETASGEDGDNDKYRKSGVEAEDEKTTKEGKANQATTKTLATISEDCDDILSFLQAIVVKSPQVITSPLSLQADKRKEIVVPR